MPWSSQGNSPGVSSKRDLHLPKVLHRSFVEVNEEGMEVMATTAAIMMMPPVRMIPRFSEDHPFLFFIQHTKANFILCVADFPPYKEMVGAADRHSPVSY
ncbi:hypothetical protein J1605_019945 [Eschrichtius robustus]|uniref:Serpin domain-containing protein n=1 Tax=Eschrichtius robustus TaxID=9764 RepID=A0AB34HM75_ESCRO|nr:hypothetical protein J1605_019945 [Eschrichtius robustus]